MCFSSKSSLFTFIFGIISSILLIYFGNKKFNKENIVFALYFIFVSFMQLFDYFFWIDLNNKNKINEKITLIAPLFNYTQPLFLFIVKSIIYKNIKLSFFSIINFFYIISVFIDYKKFLNNEKNKITKIKETHLFWPWKKYLNINFYLTLSTLNVFYLTNFKYSFIIFILGAISLLISHYYIKYSVGELWCLFIVLIPLIMIPLSYLI
jgi:hypothetical protein